MGQEINNKYVFDDVDKILKSYNDMKRKAAQLEFEVSNYTPIINNDDVIDTMSFKTSLGDGTNVRNLGQASDKTAYAAISYEEQTKRLNVLHKNELKENLQQINMEIRRIEYYISLLDIKYSRIISMLYMGGLTYLEVASRNKISVSTVRKLRITGICKLTDMYNNLV